MLVTHKLQEVAVTANTTRHKTLSLILKIWVNAHDKVFVIITSLHYHMFVKLDVVFEHAVKLYLLFVDHAECY